jgi:hypothetical protein
MTAPLELIGLGDTSQQSAQLLFTCALSLNLPAQSFHKYRISRLGGDIGAALIPCGLNETSFSYFQRACSIIRRITADDSRNPLSRPTAHPS